MPKHTRNATRLATITTMAAAATLALAACGQSAAQPASGGETGAAKDTIVVAAVPAEESANLHAQFDGINKAPEVRITRRVCSARPSAAFTNRSPGCEPSVVTLIVNECTADGANSPFRRTWATATAGPAA